MSDFGTLQPAFLMQPTLRALMPLCTSPVPVSEIAAGRRRAKQLILESRTLGTELLADRIASAESKPRCSFRAPRLATTAIAPNR